jgi:transcriptional regulator with XRE-family HTH domain
LKHRYSQRHNKLRATLKESRLAAGMTQEQLCKRLKRNRLFVSQIETGTVMLDVLEFIEYAGALGVDPRKLLGKVL